MRLQGQPLQVLATLLKRPGDLVTREEIRAEIWPADTFVDFDHSLHNAIARIREALGDSPQKARYIETLPRRGYRFIAELETVEETQEAPPELPATNEGVDEPGIRNARPRSLVFLALTLLALAIIGLASWMAAPFSRWGSTPPALRSIAVLPLENLSGDASQDYFVDGMTEELITDLAKFNSLRVTSRTSVMRYKGTKKSLPEIARELKVDGIVEGSVMRSGKRVRVTAQLLHAPSDQHLWAESYERDLGDVLTLQSEVAQAIAQQVRAQSTPQQQARWQSSRPVDPEAYESYLRGRYYLTTEFSKAEELKAARRYFETAIQKDASFALAYAGLADTFTYLAFFRQISPEDAYLSAKQALSKALELDDSMGEAHDTLAVLSWRYDRDWKTADREFNRAIALAPSYSCAREDRSEYFAFQGKRAEALAEVSKSMEMDPGPSSAMTEAGAFYQLRDYAGLLEASRRGLVSNPNEWLEHYYLGVAYEGLGKMRESISEYLRAVELSNGDQDAAAALAHAYAVVGKRAAAEKILSDLVKRSKTGYVSPYLMATIHAGLGNKDRSFELLEQSYRERSLDITWFLKADVRIDNLRSDPRFRRLLERVGLTTDHS